MSNPSWRDLEVLGRRNNKIIKYMETRLFKVKKDDPDAIVHYATAIGSLTRQNIKIIKLVDNYEFLNNWVKERNKEQEQKQKQRGKHYV